jgi:hypothetical protein
MISNLQDNADEILQRISSLFHETICNKDDIIRRTRESQNIVTLMGTKFNLDFNSKNNHIWEILLQKGGNEAASSSFI